MEPNTSHSNIADGKSTAIIAYITLIGLIVAFVQNSEKKNAYANFHIRQSLGLMCTGLALSLINIIPLLGWIICIVGMFVLLVLWIKGLLNAINGKELPVPVMGNLYDKWFSGIQ
ncbi:hypothetical protein MTP09_07385 [Chryseobacterium suipulveris]|uniref:DUF4870 domain-containing protein n=1 Tax=Chryseobacterium suipulveris TaxID=2929800 RepID=A0ABY4BPV1_9FLAO|nr:hypothetical protein [Chryseobacterium suipulveris]UOE39748.1 hypothetical protein MTP09_07385 [Chryseobacterium suipulveris]